MDSFTELLNETLCTNNERYYTYSTKIMAEIGKLPGLKRLNSWTVSDGIVGLFRYEHDGNAYEIEVRPISVGKHKELWGDQIKKRGDREDERV